MDRSFLKTYNDELQHLRGMAVEFAREFPKIAGRLALTTDLKDGCADPFVERLLEGFAFLAARVQLKLDAEFPRFVQALLESVYPHYLCPTPSMAIVRMETDPQDPGTPEGFVLPRSTPLRSIGGGSETPCEFQTAHPVHIWPLRVLEARYFTRDIVELELPEQFQGKAAFRIRLKGNGGAKLNSLKLDRLPVFVRGLDTVPSLICEQLFARRAHILIKTSRENGNLCIPLPPDSLHRIGLTREEAMLPLAPRGFEGYRLMHEYFALPERLYFVEFSHLQEALAGCDCDQVDLIIVLREPEPQLDHRVDSNSFALYCTPIINLFRKRLDPVSLQDRFSEFHVVPDRTRPLDFEVYEIRDVIGHGASADALTHFQPFYLARDEDTESMAYYTIHRIPRLLSAREKHQGAASSYTGSNAFISLVDAHSAPYRSDLLQLSIEALCTNRHLPIQIATGVGKTDFTLDVYAPVTAVRCLCGPTMPAPAHADGEIGWRIISHLSLNYLSLLQTGSDGAAGIRELLKLYGDRHDPRLQKQIAGIVDITSNPVVRRIPTPGPITFARGLEITIEFDESAFEGAGVFALGSVLEQFFARYTSINSFTETVIKSKQRGEIIRWTMQPGKRHIL